jgi:hypothetical protein
MTNPNVQDIFAGLDGASVMERNPKFPPNCRALCTVSALKKVQGDNGLSIVFELEVVESGHPEVHAKEIRSVTINGMGSPKRQDQDRALGKMKNAIASLFQISPESQQRWGELANYCLDKGAANGKQVIVQTGAEAKSKAGFPYVPTTFHPAV